MALGSEVDLESVFAPTPNTPLNSGDNHKAGLPFGQVTVRLKGSNDVGSRCGKVSVDAEDGFGVDIFVVSLKAAQLALECC